MVVHEVLGISAMLIVLHLILVQRCFVSMMRLNIIGFGLNLEIIFCGLDILTCYHMEEGKVLSSMAGSQDALLPTPIGWQVNQTMNMTIQIMLFLIIMEAANGITALLKTKLTAAVSTTQLLKDLFLSRAYAIPYYIHNLTYSNLYTCPLTLLILN